MSSYQQSHLYALLSRILGAESAARLGAQIAVADALCVGTESVSEDWVPRAVIAEALTLSLLAKSMSEVPDGARYVAETSEAGRHVVFDHGALRTVTQVNTGRLPMGQAAFARILGPLGFEDVGLYPLTNLRMMGHAWRHADHPEDIAQFFVSELDVSAFSPDFHAAAERVVGHSNDPLSEASKGMLAQLVETRSLALESSVALVSNLVACFARQHRPPMEADYETLASESVEMAWIATEGNVFNHAADRVVDVDAVASAQRSLGRSLKDTVEVSASGRVRQTAYRAATVWRVFRGEGDAIVQRPVPGSFFEFISRDVDPDTGALDLRFDAGNAQGIFQMTRPEESSP